MKSLEILAQIGAVACIVSVWETRAYRASFSTGSYHEKWCARNSHRRHHVFSTRGAVSFASSWRFSRPRRVSCTIMEQPKTNPATPTVPETRPKRAMKGKGRCRPDVANTAPKSEIRVAAANDPRDK